MALPLPSLSPPVPQPRRSFPEGPLLRSITELDERVDTETVLRLAHPRVVFADYEVLQHDFPELQDDTLIQAHPRLARLPGQERPAAIHQLIDDWLLRNATIISERQASQTRVNTPIQTTGERLTAHRPPRYGRAVVVELTSDPGLSPCGSGRPGSSWGLLDLKGRGWLRTRSQPTRRTPTGCSPSQMRCTTCSFNGLSTRSSAMRGRSSGPFRSMA